MNPESKVKLNSQGLAALLFLSALVSLFTWAVSSPVGSSPDDDYHLTSIWCAQNTSVLCQPTGEIDSREVSLQLSKASCFAYNNEESAACQITFFGSNGSETSQRGNFVGEYPPLFYFVMNLFASENVQISVILMRVINLSFFVVSSFILAFFLPQKIRNAFSITWLISIVPLGMFIIPSTNPSSWAIFGLVNSVFALIGFLQSQKQKDSIIFSILYFLFVIFAIGSRTDASAFVVFSSLFTFFIFYKGFSIAKVVIPVLGIAASSAAFISSRQSVVAVTGLSTVTGQEAIEVSQRSGFSVFGFNLIQIPELFIGIFGTSGLGWLDTRMPATVWVFSLSVFTGVIFFFLRSMPFRNAIGIGLFSFGVLAVPMYMLQVSTSRVGENIQSRYIYPLVIVLAGFIIVTAVFSRLQLGVFQIALVAFALSIANSIALYTNMSRYIQGQGWGTNWNLNFALETGWWWPNFVPPMQIWLIGSVSFLALSVISLYIIRDDFINNSRIRNEKLTAN